MVECMCESKNMIPVELGIILIVAAIIVADFEIMTYQITTNVKHR